ncbi:hypothetical protein AK812_SmicGene43159 [Symbiodinium microadriaticum]|uniref:Uncharacterized protein n=1 Tax=Symbiodinium microadriaticum TaxID=2951 RepID=A0A1Q9C1P8_SYMMI|nr:hypothetical protein AK812_SmicGene43159 [Symbiodinium microadriaticum]
MTLVQGTAPDPRHQYVWWRGSWWTWAYGSWYLYTEARQSQEPNGYPDMRPATGPSAEGRRCRGGMVSVAPGQRAYRHWHRAQLVAVSKALDELRVDEIVAFVSVPATQACPAESAPDERAVAQFSGFIENGGIFRLMGAKANRKSAPEEEGE